MPVEERPLPRAALRIALASTMVFLSGGISRALDPRLDPSRTVEATWQTDDGLPEDYVQALLQTRDGYLWVGTTNGLARFDGERFTLFGGRRFPAFRNDNVVSLAEAADGTLWIGTDTGGMVSYRDGQFRPFGESQGLPRNLVKFVFTDHRGALWVGIERYLVRLADGKLTTFTAKDGLPDGYLRAICEGESGSLWIGTSAGLARYSGGPSRSTPRMTACRIPWCGACGAPATAACGPVRSAAWRTGPAAGLSTMACATAWPTRWCECSGRTTAGTCGSAPRAA